MEPDPWQADGDGAGQDYEIGDGWKLQMPSLLILMSFSKAELEKRLQVHEC